MVRIKSKRFCLRPCFPQDNIAARPPRGRHRSAGRQRCWGERVGLDDQLRQGNGRGSPSTKQPHVSAYLASLPPKWPLVTATFKMHGRKWKVSCGPPSTPRTGRLAAEISKRPGAGPAERCLNAAQSARQMNRGSLLPSGLPRFRFLLGLRTVESCPGRRRKGPFMTKF